MKKYFKPVLVIVSLTDDIIRLSGGYDEDDGFFGEEFDFDL